MMCDVHRASSSWMRKSTARVGRGDASFGPHVATMAPRGIIPSDLAAKISWNSLKSCPGEERHLIGVSYPFKIAF